MRDSSCTCTASPAILRQERRVHLFRDQFRWQRKVDAARDALAAAALALSKRRHSPIHTRRRTGVAQTQATPTVTQAQ
jgi:multidrug resistance efflux pump